MSKETIKSTWSLRDCFKQYQEIQGGKNIKLSEAIQTALVVKVEQQLAEKDKEIELDKLILDGERGFYKKHIKELEEQLNQKT